MSETSARASRRAFWFGSLDRKGLIGRRANGAPPEVDVPLAAAAALVLTAPAGDDVGAPRGSLGRSGLVAGGGTTGAAEAVDTGAIGVTSRAVAASRDAPGVAASRGAPSPSSAGDGTKAGVGGRSVGASAAGGAEGVASGGIATAGVTGVGRRGGAKGGTRTAPASRTTASRAGGVPNEDGISCVAVASRDVVSTVGGDDTIGGAYATGTGVAATGSGSAAGGVGAGAGAGNETVAERRTPSVECVDAIAGQGAPAPDAIELGNSSAQRTLAPTGINPPQMEHRARRLAPVTFTGSTRKTDWHSGHETFMTRQSH